MRDRDEDLTEVTVYSNNPWLLENASPLFEPIFQNAPVETFDGRSEQFFGAAPYVWWIEEGLIATYASCPGIPNLMMGLFGRHSLLGAFKAITHRDRITPLTTKVLLPARARRVSASAFRTYLEKDEQLAGKVLPNLLRLHENQMERLLLNDLLPVDVRLARMVETLYRAAGGRLSAELTAMPVPVTVLDLAEMVHADRAFVSRILSQWAARGLFARNGRRLSFAAGILDEVGRPANAG